jgi:hypothetical protein
LNKLLDESLTPGESPCIVQFKLPIPPVQGALRRVKEVDGMFELMAAGQQGPNGSPILISNFFTADQVSSVMVVRDAPQIQRPNSSIVIPS